MLMMAGQASGNMPEEARNPNISNSTSSAYPPLGTCPVVSAHQKKYAHAWGQAPGDLQTMECLKNDIQLGGVTAKNAGGGGAAHGGPAGGSPLGAWSALYRRSASFG